MASFPDLFESMTRKSLTEIQSFKKEFNPEDPVYEIEEGTPDYIKTDIKKSLLLNRLSKLFDDMPNDITGFGMKILLPDLMTLEIDVKSLGYPKFVNLILAYQLYELHRVIKSRKENEKNPDY